MWPLAVVILTNMLVVKNLFRVFLSYKGWVFHSNKYNSCAFTGKELFEDNLDPQHLIESP